MDPLSLAFGIAGLVTLTLEVAKIISDYTSSVKHAATESCELAVELSALADALGALERFVDSQRPDVKPFHNTSILYSTTDTCHAKLSSLQSILQKFLKATEGRKWYRAIVWPFKRDEHILTITTLHRCMQIFQFSLSVDGSDLLSKTSEEISTIRQTQSGTSEEVTEILVLVENLDIAFQDMGQLCHGIHNEITELHKGQLDDERQKLLDWISNSGDMSTNHNRAFQKREPETGVWFLESDDFYNWIKSRGFLWLHGIPGCGKSVLCSTIIEAVKDVCAASTSHKLAYFYFNFQDIEKQDVAILLRSLIRQLCASEIVLPGEVQTMYTRCKAAGHAPTIRELETTLFAVVNNLGKETYIIIDALDEFLENAKNAKRQDLLDQITQLIEHGSENLHILATSRDEPDIHATLGSLAGGGISLQGSKIYADIRKYVRARLKKDPFKKLQSSIKEIIEAKLGEGANGMFRWAVCQLDILENCRTPNAIKKALKELPKTLDETYARILTTIAENDFEEARSIFQWLAFSERPLSLQEVAEAAILRPGVDPIDPDERFYNASDILRICRSLVSLSREHLYTCGVWIECDVAAHTYIGECCISYQLQVNQLDLSEQCLDDNPLLRYSAEHWFMHVKEVEDDADIIRSLLNLTYKLFSQESARSFLNWLRVYDPVVEYDKHNFQKGISDIASPLFYASLLGLRDTTQRLLEAGDEVNTWDSRDVSALMAASENGHYQTVQCLLDYKANIRGALPMASSGGNDQIVQLLIELGADVNEPSNGNYSDSLQEALSNGHIQIALRLLERGADVNKVNDSWGSTLTVAMEYLNEQVIQELLNKGADVNGPGSGRYGNPLQQAAAIGSDQVVQWLLERGAHVNGSCYYYCSALQAASAGGNYEVFDRLLERGADINAQGGLLGTALQAASLNGHYKIVERLLQLGVDVNIHDGGKNDPGTALQAASGNGHGQIVQLLLKHRADVNAQGGKGRAYLSTPLQAASARGHYQIVQLLLDSGAEINTPGRDYGSALQAASARGDYKIVRLLIDSGADVNAQGDKEHENRSKKSEMWKFKNHGNALQTASARGRYRIVQLLIDSGAEVNAENKDFGTALQPASAEGHYEIVQLLIDSGADINAGNKDYGTALQAALENGQDKVVQLLLEHRAISE